MKNIQNITDLPNDIYNNLKKELVLSGTSLDSFTISEYGDTDDTVFEDPNFMVLLPTSCYGCGKTLAVKQEMFTNLQKDRNMSFPYIMQHLGISRLCCKRHFMSPAVIPMGARKKPEFDISITDISPNVNSSLIGSVTSMRLNRLKNRGTAQYALDLGSNPVFDVEADFILPDIDDELGFIGGDIPDMDFTI
jgi:DNA-directed RNA polymerase subunit N (RpoN/RPB10)